MDEFVNLLNGKEEKEKLFSVEDLFIWISSFVGNLFLSWILERKERIGFERLMLSLSIQNCLAALTSTIIMSMLLYKEDLETINIDILTFGVCSTFTFTLISSTCFSILMAIERIIHTRCPMGDCLCMNRLQKYLVTITAWVLPIFLAFAAHIFVRTSRQIKGGICLASIICTICLLMIFCEKCHKTGQNCLTYGSCDHNGQQELIMVIQIVLISGSCVATLIVALFQERNVSICRSVTKRMMIGANSLVIPIVNILLCSLKGRCHQNGNQVQGNQRFQV